MTNTLSYDYGREGTQNGWISRYSYEPEWMTSLNSTMYSFKEGQIYKHDSINVPRATFYGTKFPVTITTEFNQSPLDKKMFKTLHLDSDDTWDATVDTDLGSGEVDAVSFQKKEGDWFAYLRRSDGLSINDEDAVSLSTQGLGAVSSFGGGQIDFTTGIDSSSFAIGDRIYRLDPSTGFVYIGVIDSFTDISVSISGIVGSVSPGDFITVGKNKVAESYGIRGYYMSVTLSNSNDSPVELFAVSSSIFKSFP